MKFWFYETLYWEPPLKVVWGPTIETMQGPPLEGQRVVKCHPQRKVPHCRICILWKENVNVWKRQKEILMINLFYSISQKIMTYHPFALCISMYFGIRKTSLHMEFCSHHSLFWFSFQKSRLIHDEWKDGFELKMVNGLAKLLNYSAGFCIWDLNFICYKELFKFICEWWLDLPSEFR